MLSISNARQKFFDLFQAVTKRYGHKVIITSRGGSAHAVLVAESYLNELEAAAKKLRDIEGDTRAPARDFKIVGSGKLVIDDPIGELRRQANAAAEKKLASLCKPS